MNTVKYRSQVQLLLDVLPEVATQDCFALHGGTAINLFVRDMPRLSVDLDVTYLPIEDRGTTLANIKTALHSMQARIKAKLPTIGVMPDYDRAKLFCTRQGVQIKIEVNTTLRGSLGEPVLLPLSEKTQEAFDRFAEMRIVPVGQLYGGKICAALDRQHPRDLFDVRYMLQTQGLSDEIKRGFLLCLLSSDRPLHEIIQPTLLDQRDTLANHFAGMSEEPFSYEEFEEVRRTLIEKIDTDLEQRDRLFLISFKEGAPAWAKYGFDDFEKFPALQWKLQIIRKLKATNSSKHQDQLEALKKKLNQDQNVVRFISSPIEPA